MLTDRNLVKLLHSIMALCGMYAEKTSSIINSLELDIDDTISEKLAQEVKEDKKKAELLRKTKQRRLQANTTAVFLRAFFPPALHEVFPRMHFYLASIRPANFLILPACFSSQACYCDFRLPYSIPFFSNIF